jgi:hypothetical protein
LDKVAYSEHPPRFDYRLTDKGRDLWPVLAAMRHWGDTYEAPDGPPMLHIHDGCGQISDVVMTCSVCGEAVDAKAVRAIRGPGAVEPLLRVAQP